MCVRVRIYVMIFMSGKQQNNPRYVVMNNLYYSLSTKKTIRYAKQFFLCGNGEEKR